MTLFSLRLFQVKKDFISLLKEHKDIDRHSHWSDCKKKLETDWRYRCVESASAREDWFRDYIRNLKEERKKEKDKDKDHRHREKDHHKSEKRDRERKDDRHKDKSSKDKSDKDAPKEKKQKKETTSSEENGKEKIEVSVEKEVGEIDDNEEKMSRKEIEVRACSNFFLLRRLYIVIAILHARYSAGNIALPTNNQGA